MGQEQHSSVTIGGAIGGAGMGATIGWTIGAIFGMVIGAPEGPVAMIELGMGFGRIFSIEFGIGGAIIGGILANANSEELPTKYLTPRQGILQQHI